MQVIQGPSVLKGEIREIFEKCYHSSSNYAKVITADVERGLRGEQGDNKSWFMVPGADGEGPVYFENRELLCRFLTLRPEVQKDLIKALKLAFTEHNVKEIECRVRWSSIGYRTLRVENRGRSLEFHIQ